MPFSNFNPPFTNRTLEDFFKFESGHRKNAILLRDWILDTYPDLEIGLSYHVPFFYLNKKKLFYFHYFKNEKSGLILEISFVKGVKIKDKYNLFQKKNKETKSIAIVGAESNFLTQLRYYIDAVIQQNIEC